jgi:hypothetical protein
MPVISKKLTCTEIKRELYCLLKQFDTINPNRYVVYRGLKIKRIDDKQIFVYSDKLAWEYSPQQEIKDALNRPSSFYVNDLNNDNYIEVSNRYLLLLLLKDIQQWAVKQKRLLTFDENEKLSDEKLLVLLKYVINDNLILTPHKLRKKLYITNCLYCNNQLFNIYPNEGTYKCSKCNTEGTLIDFIKEFYKPPKIVTCTELWQKKVL